MCNLNYDQIYKIPISEFIRILLRLDNIITHYANVKIDNIYDIMRAIKLRTIKLYVDKMIDNTIRLIIPSGLKQSCERTLNLI